MTLEAVQAALATVIDPNPGRDLIAGESTKNIQVNGDDVSFDIELGYPARSQIAPICRSAIAAVRAIPGAGNVSVNVHSKPSPTARSAASSSWSTLKTSSRWRSASRPPQSTWRWCIRWSWRIRAGSQTTWSRSRRGAVFVPILLLRGGDQQSSYGGGQALLKGLGPAAA